jgi:hypothetical protein
MNMDDYNDDYSGDTSSDSASFDDSSSDSGSEPDWNNMDPPEDDDEKLEEWMEKTGNWVPIPQTLEVNGEYVTVNADGTVTDASGMPIGQIDQSDVSSIQYDDVRLTEAVDKSRRDRDTLYSGSSGDADSGDSGCDGGYISSDGGGGEEGSGSYKRKTVTSETVAKRTVIAAIVSILVCIPGLAADFSYCIGAAFVIVLIATVGTLVYNLSKMGKD